jgi:hypothetical protein
LQIPLFGPPQETGFIYVSLLGEGVKSFSDLFESRSQLNRQKTIWLKKSLFLSFNTLAIGLSYRSLPTKNGGKAVFPTIGNNSNL